MSLRSPNQRSHVAAWAMAAFALLTSCRHASIPTPADPAPRTSTRPSALAAAVAALRQTVEAERVRVATPGAALLVVADDRILASEGFGFADAERKIPVDADTVFAIGSITQAFTAMLVMQAIEAGGLSGLSARPKACLPEFSLRDPVANDKVTVRDLLTHHTGLGRTDLAWYSGALTRAELLTVAGLAEPASAYGTQPHDQNLMVVAAGECAARALGGRYEDLVRARIFEPLGMQSIALSHAEFVAAPTRAQGFRHVGDARRAVAVPPRNVDAIAPAASASASVRALAPWLRFMLAGGELEGKRLVSEESFARIVAPHVPAGPGIAYGLGWVVDTWQGQPRIWHNGGIDGFYALISMLPERGIGFVLLTSDESAALEAVVTRAVFSLLDAPDRAPATPAGFDETQWAGTYGIIGGFQAVIATTPDGTAMLTVPEQRPYPLVPTQTAGTWSLGPPAPPGLSIKLSGEGQARTLEIVQPQGTIALAWLDPEQLAQARRRALTAPERGMLGVYRDDTTGVEIRLIASQGRLALSAAGQAPAPLVPDGKDVYALDGLPNAFGVRLVRHNGRTSALHLTQPQGNVTLSRVPGTEPYEGTLDDLWAAVARAHGSPAMAAHETMTIQSALRFPHQGVEGTAQTLRRRPDRFAEILTLKAVGKQLGTISVGYTQGRAWERSSMSSTVTLRAVEGEALALQAAFAPWAAPMRGWAEAELLGVQVVDGEPVLVVRRRTQSGIAWTDAFGRKSMRLLQRTTSVPGPHGAPPTIEVLRFGDYRDVGGVTLAHAVESTTANGTVVSTVQSVRLDTAVDLDAFAPPRASVGG